MGGRERDSGKEEGGGEREGWWEGREGRKEGREGGVMVGKGGNGGKEANRGFFVKSLLVFWTGSAVVPPFSSTHPVRGMSNGEGVLGKPAGPVKQTPKVSTAD